MFIIIIVLFLYCLCSFQHAYIRGLLGIYHYWCVTMLWMKNKIHVGSCYVYFWCVCVCVCVCMCVQSLISLIRLDRIKQVDIYFYQCSAATLHITWFVWKFFWNYNFELLWRGGFIYFFYSSFWQVIFRVS